MNKRLQSFLKAMLVVALWSASPPLAKIVYAEISPVQVTAIRYSCAALVLLPFLLVRSRTMLRDLNRSDWLKLALMGLMGFSIGNTVMYIGLKTLPATTTSFLLNGIPVITVILGALTLGELPRRAQWGGILLALLGGLIFFGWRIEINQIRPVLLSLLGVLMISLYGLLARGMTRDGRIDPISLTAIPMGFGSLLLLFLIWPLPQLSWNAIAILAWLTLVNSAMAFVLWNNALKHMQAFEISITGNLMPIGTAILAPIFLGESVSSMAWLGMVLSLIGVILVGLGGRSAAVKGQLI